MGSRAAEPSEMEGVGTRWSSGPFSIGLRRRCIAERQRTAGRRAVLLVVRRAVLLPVRRAALLTGGMSCSLYADIAPIAMSVSGLRKS
jgi:hypothetical protein